MTRFLMFLACAVLVFSMRFVAERTAHANSTAQTQRASEWVDPSRSSLDPSDGWVLRKNPSRDDLLESKASSAAPEIKEVALAWQDAPDTKNEKSSLAAQVKALEEQAKPASERLAYSIAFPDLRTN